jgi:hypothetical protein
VILEDHLRRHAVADQRLSHRVGLVVGPAVVVAGDEDAIDLAGPPQLQGAAHAVGEHRAHPAVGLDQGPGDDRRLGVRNVGDIVGRLARAPASAPK